MAEDDPVSMRLMTPVVEKAGYSAVTARDGREALRVLESDPDIAHWWAHPAETRRVTEEWTKLGVYLVQGAYF